MDEYTQEELANVKWDIEIPLDERSRKMSKKKDAPNLDLDLEQIDPDALIKEEEEWKARQAEKRQRAISILLEERQAIDEKLAKLGYSEAPRSKSGATGTTSRKARTCPKCGKAEGHGWRRCPNPAQASWANDPRSKEG